MELRIRDVARLYPSGVRALSGVSLTIPRGVFGLLGPSGSGKSTLLRTIATLQEPDDGAITLGGVDVLGSTHEARSMIGYLPQEFGLFPRLSAENLLDYFAVAKGIIERRARREVVEALLQRASVWNERRQVLDDCSGATRQRFAVAVALLGDPKLLLVDEPTSSLDAAERLRFLNLLAGLGEDRIVLLATRSIHDVSECCTRMAVIDRGEILLEAATGRAVDDLQGRIWRRVAPRDQLLALEPEHAVVATRLLGGQSITRVFGDALPGPGFEPAEAGLEDVYFCALAGYVGRRGRRHLQLVEHSAHRRLTRPPRHPRIVRPHHS